jgi:hypothetical protein
MGTVNVKFEIIWRDSADRDTVLASTMHTFVGRPPGPNQYDAILFETDLPGIAAPARPGDQLLFKFSVPSGDMNGNYTPNGDGPAVKGRFPSITLP